MKAFARDVTFYSTMEFGIFNYFRNPNGTTRLVHRYFPLTPSSRKRIEKLIRNKETPLTMMADGQGEYNGFFSFHASFGARK